MRALVIGGTRFVGRGIVDALKARGDEITLFSRGRTPNPYPELDHVVGDRVSDLDRLGDRRFDVILDTCGFVPAQVEPSARLAAEQGAAYVFVSTVSVYDVQGGEPSLGEDAALADPQPDTAIDDRSNYGAAKVLCERALDGIVGDRVAHVRAGLIVGPWDYTDRYTYWAWRMAQPGPVLCPGDGDDPVQVIDARDLGAFAVHLAATEAWGPFNTVGTHEMTMRALIAASTPEHVEPELVWVPSEVLEAHGVEAWQHMTAWVPRDHAMGAIARARFDRAVAAGLTTRPLAETAADTRAWLAETGRTLDFATFGLAPEKEREVLEAVRLG